MENGSKAFLAVFSALGVLNLASAALSGEGALAPLGLQWVDIVAAVLCVPVWLSIIIQLWRRT